MPTINQLVRHGRRAKIAKIKSYGAEPQQLQAAHGTDAHSHHITRTPRAPWGAASHSGPLA